MADPESPAPFVDSRKCFEESAREYGADTIAHSHVVPRSDGKYAIAYAYRTKYASRWHPELDEDDIAAACYTAFDLMIDESDRAQRRRIYLATSGACEKHLSRILALINSEGGVRAARWDEQPFKDQFFFCPGPCGPPDGGVKLSVNLVPKRCGVVILPTGQRENSRDRSCAVAAEARFEACVGANAMRAQGGGGHTRIFSLYCGEEQWREGNSRSLWH